MVLHQAGSLKPKDQDLLRISLEAYNKKCQFILLCENSFQLSEPIQSRLLKIGVGKPTKESQLKILRSIVEKESIVISDQDLQNIIDQCDDNLEKAIIKIQMKDYDLNEPEISEYSFILGFVKGEKLLNEALSLNQSVCSCLKYQSCEDFILNLSNDVSEIYLDHEIIWSEIIKKTSCMVLLLNQMTIPSYKN